MLCLLAVLLILAPAARADTVRVVFGSCAHQNGDQGFWTPMIAEKPDLALLIGDNVYADVYGPDADSLRTAYATLSGHAGFRALKQSARLLATWDDHDYGTNDGGGDFAYKAESEALFESVFPAAPGSGRDDRPGIYDAWATGPPGARLQVVLLDTRFFRSPLKPTDDWNGRGKERYMPDDTPTKTLLGAAQWAWLKARLEEPADVRLIVSSIQVVADGHGFERWGNLPRERDRVYDLIADTGAKGVVFLSGDRHRAALYRLDGRTPYPLHEITSSSLNLPRGGNEPGPHRLGDFYNEANYGLVAVDWQRRTLSLQIKDMAGEPVRAVEVPLAALAPPG